MTVKALTKWWIQTQNLLTGRQQCKPLLHYAPQRYNYDLEYCRSVARL